MLLTYIIVYHYALTGEKVLFGGEIAF